MRIRCIKPEFWTDEELSALSAETVLLAAALNNYADDEGYFNANPKLIEAALMPLRQLSVPIPGMLNELAKIGWIEVRNIADGKAFGRLVHFERDQVISRPRPSEVRQQFDAATEASVSNHGVLTEASVSNHGVLTEGSVSNHSSVKTAVFTDAGALSDHSRSTPWGMEGKGKERKGTGSGGAVRPRDRSRRHTSGSIHPSEQEIKTRTRMLAIGTMLRRLDSTRWSAEEFQAYKDSGLDVLTDDYFAEQLAPVAAYYAANIPREKDYRRRDVLRLLRNWAGELDRARAWARDHHDGLVRV